MTPSALKSVIVGRNAGLNAIGLVALVIAAPLAIGTRAQAPRVVATDAHVRDLAVATPESVGVSSERLRRVEAAMKRVVDEKQIAGVVTLMERHGKAAS